MGLLRTILIISLIYVGLRLIRTLFFSSPKPRQSARPNQGAADQRKEGEVKVESVPEEYKKSSKSSDGEYVDYEEVKD